MSDITCQMCGEPWDASEVRDGDLMTPEEAQRFLHGEGCPACAYGTRCRFCDGTGREPGPYGRTACPECRGKRFVFVQRYPRAVEPALRQWHISDQPARGPEVAPWPAAQITIEHSQIGPRAHSRAYCPSCWATASECTMCGGDGLYHPPDAERRTQLQLARIASLAEGSDEDIIEYL